MKLNVHYFNQIEQTTKTIEVRLNDEKRRVLHVGDTIVFSNTEDNRLLITKITKLDIHKTFESLFTSAPTAAFGIDENGNLPDMYQFYSKIDEEKYGVVGIHVSEITTSTTQDITVAAYNQDLSSYQAKLPPDEVVEKTIDHIIPYLDKQHPILEIGSGTGRDADYLEKNGFQVIRTEVANSFISFQQSKGKKISSYNVLLQTYTPPQHAILMNGVFVHFTENEAEQALNNCYKSLEKNGYLCINTKEGNTEELVTNMAIPRFMKKWPKEKLTTLIQKADLTIIETKLSDDGEWRIYILKK